MFDSSSRYQSLAYNVTLLPLLGNPISSSLPTSWMRGFSGIELQEGFPRPARCDYVAVKPACHLGTETIFSKAESEGDPPTMPAMRQPDGAGT